MKEQTVISLNDIERDRWNTFVANSRWGHVMQSWEWGNFKSATGWQVQRIGIEDNGQLVAGAQVLFRSLPLLPFTVAYIPRGPIVDFKDQATTARLLSTIHQITNYQKAVFLKIEPNVLDNNHVYNTLQNYGFYPSNQTNQPRSTLVINVADNEEAVFNNINKKSRKLIRRAIRLGAEVDHNNQNVDMFYTLLSTTAKIKGFSIPDKFFFEKMWDAFKDTGCRKLLFIKHGDEIVAGKMILAFRDRSMHLWGGTTLKGREVFASYLSQWEAIKWAQNNGYKYVDLWGIKDQIGSMLYQGQLVPKDKEDGLWGIYQFKRGFGPEFEYYVGAYDYAYHRSLYRVMQLVAHYSSVYSASRWLEFLQR